MSKEMIVSIEEITGISKYGGVLITTTDQVIELLIDDSQRCCEDVGYFLTEDRVENFIGAELIDLRLTDDELAEVLMETFDMGTLDGSIGERRFEGGLMFVDIVTDRGVLQFVAYNEHNGHYGHDVSVRSKQLKYYDTL